MRKGGAASVTPLCARRKTRSLRCITLVSDNIIADAVQAPRISEALKNEIPQDIFDKSNASSRSERYRLFIMPLGMSHHNARPTAAQGESEAPGLLTPIIRIQDQECVGLARVITNRSRRDNIEAP